MRYCKSSSEFNLFDEFKPGEFEIVDFFREKIDESKARDFNEEFLYRARYACFDEPPFDLDIVYLSESVARYTTRFVKLDNELSSKLSNKLINPSDYARAYSLHEYEEVEEIRLAIEKQSAELDKIIDVLINRHFIRTDLRTSLTLCRLLFVEDYHWIDFLVCHGLDYDIYETIKPLPATTINSILKKWKAELTHGQYDVVSHYLRFAMRTEVFSDDHYYYSDTEMELFNAARKNVVFEIKHILDLNIELPDLD